MSTFYFVPVLIPVGQKVFLIFSDIQYLLPNTVYGLVLVCTIITVVRHLFVTGTKIRVRSNSKLR
jgi:hypothetical protein